MTQTFIAIHTEDKDYLYRKSGMLTRGFFEDNIVQLINHYPINNLANMIEFLKMEEWEISPIHPAYLFSCAEKLVYLQYDKSGNLEVLKNFVDN